MATFNDTFLIIISKILKDINTKEVNLKTSFLFKSVDTILDVG